MTSGLEVFDNTIDKTNHLLNAIEDELNWHGRRNQSYHALRTVLHALRDRLPLNESVNFAAQLPLLLKGVYFDGWNPDIIPIKMNREEFVGFIRDNFPFDLEITIEDLIRIVGNKLFRAMDPNEADKIMGEMPSDIAELFY